MMEARALQMLGELEFIQIEGILVLDEKNFTFETTVERN